MTNHDVEQKFYIEVQRFLIATFGIHMDYAAIIATGIVDKILGSEVRGGDFDEYKGDKGYAERAARLSGSL